MKDDHRSYIHNFCSCEKKAWTKFRLLRILRYRCKLTSQLGAVDYTGWRSKLPAWKGWKLAAKQSNHRATDITSIYRTPKTQDLKYRSKHVRCADMRMHHHHHHHHPSAAEQSTTSFLHWWRSWAISNSWLSFSRLSGSPRRQRI